MARRSNAMTDCPRCGHRSLKASDQGAWCVAFPCRWSVTWARAAQVVAVARAAGRL